MRRFAGAAAGALVLAAACSPAPEPVSVSPPEPVRLSLSITPPSLSVLIAQEKGFFRNRGADVTLRLVQAGVLAAEEVARGDADLALAAETPFVLGILDGKPLTLLARLYKSTAMTGIVALRERGIADPRDLAGKRIGVVPRSSADFFVDIFLGARGVNPVMVDKVSLKPQDIEQSLLKGEVDAVSTWQPTNLRLAARLGERGVSFTDPVVYEFTFNLVARDGFARERPAAAQRVMAAILDAEDFMRREPAEARRLAERLLHETDGQTASRWSVEDFEASLDQPMLTLLERQILWAKGKDGGDKVMDVRRVIDEAPLRAVRPERVRVIEGANR